MREPAEIGQPQARRIRIQLLSRLRQRGQFGIGGGEEDHIGWRLSRIDRFAAIRDLAGRGREQMHSERLFHEDRMRALGVFAKPRRNSAEAVPVIEPVRGFERIARLQPQQRQAAFPRHLGHMFEQAGRPIPMPRASGSTNIDLISP